MSIVRILFLTGCLFSAATWPADVYRCVGESGEPAFSQRPCGSTTAAISQSRPQSAPASPGLRASEKAWLAERQAKQRAASRSRPSGRHKAKRGRSKTARDAAKQAYRCRQKRRALDAVKSKLRRGYKPGQGSKLRRRRRGHEDYLAAFCQ